MDSGDASVEAKRAKWEDEFATVLAGRLEEMVREAIGEYVWLFERRWRG